MPKNALQIVDPTTGGEIPDNPLLQGAGVPAHAENLIQPLRLSMPGGDAKLPVVMYHGTNERSLSMHGPEMSLTPDRTQAAGYANDYHRMDEVDGEPNAPVVHRIQATPGPALDVNADIRQYETGKVGDNADAFIAKLAESARSDGYYRYLHFDHPNMPLPGADPDGLHQVIISLYPNDDLGYSTKVMEQEDAKRRKLQGE